MGTRRWLTLFIGIKEKFIANFLPGNLTGEDLIACNMAMYGHQMFDELYIKIMDMLEVTQFECTFDDVKKVAALDKAAGRINPKMKCALVTSEQVAHKLSKIYRDGISGSPWEGKSFQALEAARGWLYESYQVS